jgi:hypothetical protein
LPAAARLRDENSPVSRLAPPAVGEASVA